MTAALIFYAGAVLGTLVGFTIAAMCTVSGRCAREEETREAAGRMNA